MGKQLGLGTSCVVRSVKEGREGGKEKAVALHKTSLACKDK